jgi:D-tyrosyl-tRNA(Tyr) deacylase
MIALVQRVARAHVEIAGVRVGEIAAGALVFVCAEPDDTPAHASRLVDKLLALRIFSDSAGKMNLSLRDTGAGLLLVSQFTLAADTSRGNRPGFSGAAQGVKISQQAVVVAEVVHVNHCAFSVFADVSDRPVDRRFSVGMQRAEEVADHIPGMHPDGYHFIFLPFAHYQRKVFHFLNLVLEGDELKHAVSGLERNGVNFRHKRLLLQTPGYEVFDGYDLQVKLGGNLK